MRLAVAWVCLPALAACSSHALEPKAPGAPASADAAIDVAHDGATDAAARKDAGFFASDAGPLPSERYRALAVAAGRDHMCALLDDHRVKCWGDNSIGQLGLGDIVDRDALEDMGDHLPAVDLGTGRTAKAIAAGRYSSCAILDDDSVKCWGLALVQTGPPAAPDDFIGNAPGEMGDALAPLDLGPGRKARLLALGYFTGCAVLDDGSSRCWDGSPTPTDIPPSPGRHVTQLAGALGVLALYDDGTFAPLGTGGNTLPSPDPTLGPDLRAIAIAGSRNYDCAVWANGSARCNGSPEAWWPPSLAVEITSVGVLEQSSYSCGIIGDGHVFCPKALATDPWNNGDSTPAGRFVRLGQPALSITSGSWFDFCAVLLDGEVKCWSDLPMSSYIHGLGGTVTTETSWPSIDLGTRPTP